VFKRESFLGNLVFIDHPPALQDQQLAIFRLGYPLHPEALIRFLVVRKQSDRVIERSYPLEAVRVPAEFPWRNGPAFPPVAEPYRAT